MGQSFQFLQNRLQPDAPFLVTGQHVYTYRDLTGFARFLESLLPARRPLKVALSAQLTDAAVLTIAACWMLEIPVIPLSPETGELEWKRIGDELRPGVFLAGLDTKTPVFSQETTCVPLPDPSSVGINKQPFNDLLAHQDHLFGYFLTSGTSGPAKIVPLKRRQFIWGAEGSAQNFKPNPGDLWLLSLPLHHVGGISIILRSLMYGSGVYLLREFNAADICDLLSHDNRIRFCSLVPTMLRRVLAWPGFRPHPDFEVALLGGGPMTYELIRAALDHKMTVATSFGMTETAAQIAAHVYRSIDKPAELNDGTIFAPNQAEVRDDHGNPCRPGSEGILWIRGPQVFDGYLTGDPDTLHFDDDGWFCSGDHARIHPGGEIEILMRRTDRIVTGGENVNPIEIEQVLVEHPGIMESAVFGLPDDEWGQRVVALVVRTSDKGVHPGLAGYLASRLKKYQIPKEIIYVSDLPYTRTGKLDRSRLPEWFKKKSNKRQH